MIPAAPMIKYPGIMCAALPLEGLAPTSAPSRRIRRATKWGNRPAAACPAILRLGLTRPPGIGVGGAYHGEAKTGQREVIRQETSLTSRHGCHSPFPNTTASENGHSGGNAV